MVSLNDYKKRTRSETKEVKKPVAHKPTVGIQKYLETLPVELLGGENSEHEVTLMIMRARLKLNSLSGVVPRQKILEQREALRDFSHQELVDILRTNEKLWGSKVAYFTAVLDQINFLST